MTVASTNSSLPSKRKNFLRDVADAVRAHPLNTVLTILVDGTELTNDLKKIDEIRRDVGMVFQHFNLFPHLTILENLTLAPIWVKKLPKKDAEEIDDVEEAAASAERPAASDG